MYLILCSPKREMQILNFDYSLTDRMKHNFFEIRQTKHTEFSENIHNFIIFV